MGNGSTPVNFNAIRTYPQQKYGKQSAHIIVNYVVDLLKYVNRVSDGTDIQFDHI